MVRPGRWRADGPSLCCGRIQAEAEGREFHPRTDPADAKPDPNAQSSFTDPESRTMAGVRVHQAGCSR